MSRTVQWVCLSLAAFLLLLPLGVPRPGMPMTLKADEPAYYLAARSLIHDGDLLCETKDLRRLFDRFPHLPVENLILMSDDGWETVRFGKPYLYSLLAAPFVALFDVRGMVALNMLLFLLMAAMAYRYLCRWNEPWMAALFAAGFFFLGPPFAYVFWLQPEILNMFGVAACLYLGMVEPTAGRPGRARQLLSAAALALAVYHKPMFAVLGLPVLWSLWRRSGWRSVAAWVSAAGVAMALIVGGSQLLSDTPSSYFGSARAGVKVEDPERLEAMLSPLKRLSQRALVADEQPLNSFEWLIRVPRLFPRLLAENAGYFLWGRHTGALLYMPFGVLAVVLFLVNDRRSTERWLTLAALIAIAFFFLVWIHYNWHGGSGAIGNRYFAGVYPAGLFLVSRIRPRWLVPLGFAAGGLFLGAITVTPYGPVVPDPTLQAHTRGWAFELFPSELTIREYVPGYENLHAHGIAFRARKDLVEVQNPGTDTLWVRGATPTEIWALSARPIDSLVIEVASLAPQNRVLIRLGEAKEVVDLEGGDDDLPRQLVELAPERATKRWRQYGKQIWAYRLVVTTRTGRNPRHASGQAIEPQFYLGAALRFLGPRSELLRKSLYRVEWHGGDSRVEVAPGDVLETLATMRNTGTEPWLASGALSVRLVHRWIDEHGRALGNEGTTPLPGRVAVGTWTQVPLRVRAPDAAGDFTLELDLERQSLARFSERGAPTARLAVTVAPMGS